MKTTPYILDIFVKQLSHLLLRISLFIFLSLSLSISIYSQDYIDYIEEENLYSVTGMEGSSFEWTVTDEYGSIVNTDFNNGIFSVEWEQAGTFFISVLETTIHGCQGEAVSAEILVRGGGIAPPPQPNIELIDCVDMPTAFSPNNDGHNDVLRVRASCEISSIDLMVFNRNGVMVFHSKSLDAVWDGTYSGETQEIDVYVYHLTATLRTGQRIEKKGNITLVK